MAFDPTGYKPKPSKKLPVILLLDVSGSMSGEKIDTLYDCVVDMVQSFVDAAVKETMIDVAIITFGENVDLHTPYTSAADLQKNGISRFYAKGMTPLGTALRMAKDMIEDKTVTPSHIYRPAILLVSDGQPNDSWRNPLDNFINDGRSKKCQRFAIAIGNDADKKVLAQFTGNPDNVMLADDASDIEKSFEKFSMSVSVRAASKNPNVVPTPPDATFDNNKKQDSDDDDEYI
jgi:uncharacterized protein YegL